MLWWNWAFKSLSEAETQSVPAYQKIAAEKAISFMQQPQMKAYKGNNLNVKAKVSKAK